MRHKKKSQQVRYAWRTCGPGGRGNASSVSALIKQLAERAADISRNLLAVTADAHRLALIQGVVEVVSGQEGQVESALPIHSEGASHCCAVLPQACVLHQEQVSHSMSIFWHLDQNFVTG